MRENVKIVISIYIISSIISFFYALFNHHYNGDFSSLKIGEVTLPTGALIIVLILNLLPYLLLWRFYCKIKTTKTQAKTLINISILGNITILLYILHIIITNIYGVGIMGNDKYTAPELIRFFSQILYRFNPIIWGSIYIMESKNRKNIYLICFLTVIYSISKHSLGIIMFLITILLLKERNFFKRFILKNKFVAILLIIIFPYIVNYGYQFRERLRSGYSTENINKAKYNDIVFDRLCGRLSSFSNSAYIMQSIPIYYYHSEELPTFFYQKDMLVPLGINFKDNYPIGSFFRSTLGNSNENNSIMAGPVGIFIISSIKSFSLLILNIITFVFLIWLVFFFFLKINISHNKELAVCFVSMNIVSGNSSELFSISIGLFLLIATIKVINLINYSK